MLPTDTMKNTVYALAKAWSGVDVEEFGLELTSQKPGRGGQEQ